MNEKPQNIRIKPMTSQKNLAIHQVMSEKTVGVISQYITKCTRPMDKDGVELTADPVSCVACARQIARGNQQDVSKVRATEMARRQAEMGKDGLKPVDRDMRRVNLVWTGAGSSDGPTAPMQKVTYARVGQKKKATTLILHVGEATLADMRLIGTRYAWLKGQYVEKVEEENA
jgi:hypothetical protein